MASASNASVASVLTSFDPRTGRERGTVPANAPQDVVAAVQAARRAQPAWAALGPRGRARTVALIRHEIHARMDQVIDVIAAENGKPRAEALTHDVLPSLLTLRYLESIAPVTLRPEHPGRLVGATLGMRSTIEWRPFGVVGCISPWNYPLLLSFMAVAPALLAGNTVVLKPSELTPGVGEMLRLLLAPLPPGVATVVQGGADVGAALVDAGCDKLCFIGSAAVGRRIAERAATHLTPVVLELGGQDAAIVCGDADLDLASSGVLWGVFLNAGQACCAIERAYVVDGVADEFERRLVEKLRRVAKGPGAVHPDIGPLTAARQLDVVERQVRDAAEHGARVLAGGPDEAAGGPDGSLWYPPTVLEGRTEDMELFGAETFGPVLPIVRVADEDEAIRRSNEDGFNLTASIWSRDRAKARRLADRMVAGTVTINDHGATASAPWGLWGGVGESGYGRLHGELGLREFTVPVHVAANTMPGTKRLWWYPYDEATTATLRGIAEVLAAPTARQKATAGWSAARSALRALRAKI